MSFTNARIVGSGINPESYHRTSEKRGTVTYPVSNSMLGLFEPCPARFFRGYERPESAALENGSLVDCLLLQPDQFENTYVQIP